MNAKTVKTSLQAHGFHVWKLCQTLGISRDTYYKYSHRNFAGHEDEIKEAIAKLVNNQKGDHKNAD